MPPEPNSLCSQCAQVFQPAYEVGDPGLTLTYDLKFEKRPIKLARFAAHHASYAAFEKSALHGCHMCLLFWNQVPDHRRVVLRQTALEGTISIYVPHSQLDSLHQYEILLHYSFPEEARLEQGSWGFIMVLQMSAATGALRMLRFTSMQLTMFSK